MIKISKGNKKIKVSNFSITPLKTCKHRKIKGCSDCSKLCYALKAYKQYPATRAAWNSNLKETKKDTFVQDMIKALKNYKKDYFRIHQAGDFYSLEYAQKWVKIIEASRHIMFYLYTKNDKAIQLIENNVYNCKCFSSYFLPKNPDELVIHETKGNYYIVLRDLKKELQSYLIHPYFKYLYEGGKIGICTTGCGESCFKCMDNRHKIIFNELH